MKPQRYQLRKDAVAVLERGHPWIFRDQLSSAAQVFPDGQWLRLVDGQNKIVGHGIFEAEGAIAIRVFRTGPEPVDASWIRGRLEVALGKRADLAKRTDGIRLVHGESDGLPAIVVDRFANTLVVASYSAGADAIARYVARTLAAIGNTVPAEPPSAARLVVGPAEHVVLRPARRRRGPALAARILRGAPPDVVRFTEDGMQLAVDLEAGHKTGTYLDLRALRGAIATTKLAGARVLNLFAYTGMLGRAAETAGAAEIIQVDTSERALAFAAAHHVGDPARHRFIIADVFEWLPALDPSETFDLVIVDPPAMTSRMTQVPSVLAAYRRLYRAAERHVRPGGAIVAACCTSRIERDVFKKTVLASLGPRFALQHEEKPEPDHPVGFPQADYLKITWWQSRAD
ncbi:MAG: rRNA ((2499)-C(5))-methyltransferase [Myxococcales bacterium]|nr:rRNA ((2499)-C(5))-methyltransferase [Myxococcales bacterium]